MRTKFTPGAAALCGEAGVPFSSYNTGYSRLMREGGRIAGVAVEHPDEDARKASRDAYVACMGFVTPRVSSALGHAICPI